MTDIDANEIEAETGAEAGAAVASTEVVPSGRSDGRSKEEVAQRFAEAREQVLHELGKVIIDQEEVLDQLLLSLFVGGNSIVTGVPGLAKTLMVQTMADVLQLDFSRIQFTPDLMPSDITGTDIIQEDPDTRERKMVFMPGPIFSQIVLADEINRTPPKTQAALLEAMQEKRVTVQGRTYELDTPFFVFATQNPIELEGTYPLPEAQLDRFMFNIIVDHLSEAGEMRVVQATTSGATVQLEHPIDADDLRAFQALVREVPVADPVLRYAIQLVRATRPDGDEARGYVREYIQYGASVRAAQYLTLGGKARALSRGRFHVDYEDIASVAVPVLRHRVLTNFQADSEGLTSDELIGRLLEDVPRERSGLN